MILEAKNIIVKLIFLLNTELKNYIKKKNTYDLFINIKYNFKPTIRNKGSAIFLHLSDNKYNPTNGCVAILKKDFFKILPLINRNTKISIG